MPIVTTTTTTTTSPGDSSVDSILSLSSDQLAVIAKGLWVNVLLGELVCTLVYSSGSVFICGGDWDTIHAWNILFVSMECLGKMYICYAKGYYSVDPIHILCSFWLINYYSTLTDLLHKTWKLHRATQLWNFNYSQLRNYSRTLTRHIKVTMVIISVLYGGWWGL